MRKLIISTFLLILSCGFAHAEKFEVSYNGKTAVVEATKEDLQALRKKAHELLIQELLKKGLAKKVKGGYELVEEADLSFFQFTVNVDKQKQTTGNVQDFIKSLK